MLFKHLVFLFLLFFLRHFILVRSVLDMKAFPILFYFLFVKITYTNFQIIMQTNYFCFLIKLMDGFVCLGHLW